MDKQALKEIREHLPSGTRLVAVSKFHSAEEILEAYAEKQRLFGENHVQEIVAKQQELPSDIEWHFIGTLQRNKVKKIVPFVSLIHSVDSLRLLSEINVQAAKIGKTIPCLLQLHVAKEATKFGFTIDECRQMLAQGQWRDMKNVKIAGLMCMATNTSDTSEIKKEFHSALEAFYEFKRDFFANDAGFCERSWGMSHDYNIAIDEGSTLIRVGTKIFGPRNTPFA